MAKKTGNKTQKPTKKAATTKVAAKRKAPRAKVKAKVPPLPADNNYVDGFGPLPRVKFIGSMQELIDKLDNIKKQYKQKLEQKSVPELDIEQKVCNDINLPSNTTGNVDTVEMRRTITSDLLESLYQENNKLQDNVCSLETAVERLNGFARVNADTKSESIPPQTFTEHLNAQILRTKNLNERFAVCIEIIITLV